MYGCLRRLLFLLPPESAHAVVIQGLNLSNYIGLLKLSANAIEKPVIVNGVHFKNPVGIAAGFDKYAAAIPGLAGLGAGFAELGTFTARPQAGNPKPRLFRLVKDHAIVNWMGLNNIGIDVAIEKIKRYAGKACPLGISISKNNDTPYEKAIEDYDYCLAKAYPHCSYITINISCPNVLNSKEFWSGDYLQVLLRAIKEKQLALAKQYQKTVPVYIKISPDLSESEIAGFSGLMNSSGLDGVVATNTTVTRPSSLQDANKSKKGGLSGEPLFPIALQCAKYLRKYLKPEMTIIGVGGIHSAETARQMLDAGCQLIQIYTGLIYRGPSLISTIVSAI